jgi:hypothetical protein
MNTDAVKGLWNFGSWPSTIENTLAFSPKNPDLVGYHPGRKKWCFCEVKGPTDRVHPDQLKALAVLHLITHSPVAIVRLVPRDQVKRRNEMLIGDIAYVGRPRLRCVITDSPSVPPSRTI